MERQAKARKEARQRPFEKKEFYRWVDAYLHDFGVLATFGDP